MLLLSRSQCYCDCKIFNQNKPFPFFHLDFLFFFRILSISSNLKFVITLLIRGTFGKAIYFSDSILKSLIYCGSDDALLALCEVALGRCEERLPRINDANIANINNEVRNYDSIQGLGGFYPESNHVRADGLIVPNGRLTYMLAMVEMSRKPHTK